MQGGEFISSEGSISPLAMDSIASSARWLSSIFVFSSRVAAT